MVKTFLVGGAVRDRLLGRPIVERDWVVVGATPDEMLAKGFRQVGKDFPVFLHPETTEEYALARTERKQGRGYTGFSCYAAPDVTLEQDLLRRDLTINAMAQTEDGEIIDPFGGLNDLKQRVLRHVSPAFVEDPLRILRVARFLARYASYGFTVAEETLILMRRMVRDGEVNALVAERVWLELSRALAEPHPEKFIELLRQCGALAVLFPELDCLFGVPNPPKWHPEIDSGVHTLMVLQKAAELSSVNEVRFAALLHDLGKGVTPQEQWPSHVGHGSKGVALIKQFCKRYKVPRDYQDLAVLVSRFHIECHQAFELRPTTLLKLLEKLDAFRRPERFEWFLLSCEADSGGRPGAGKYEQAEYIREAFQRAARVDVKAVVHEGFQGLQIAEELRKRRLQVITNYIQEKRR